MADLSTYLQWAMFLGLASLQKPFLPILRDVFVHVCMSGALLFFLVIVLSYGLADGEMRQYLTGAAYLVVSKGLTTNGDEVLVPFTYETFVSASVTMSVVTTLAVLLCCSFVLEMAFTGMNTCVAPMVALTVNMIKPQCWDNAEDYRGKIPPPTEAAM
ncbi:hypothetical protein JKF63_01789 [Porcisia hertigi]|uniref:Uncharacterized protein n=1 Tax=Porcisia hertigi TaxID=2761500 RepID=A0A836L1N9_9TRYP|nr:hypothetical protein JKF63_01789 [Porcisia hertigi]